MAFRLRSDQTYFVSSLTLIALSTSSLSGTGRQLARALARKDKCHISQAAERSKFKYFAELIYLDDCTHSSYILDWLDWRQRGAAARLIRIVWVSKQLAAGSCHLAVYLPSHTLPIYPR